MNNQPQHSANNSEAPLRHIVANLEHLRGKGLAELVRAARWRRRRIAVSPADGEPAQMPVGSLAEVLEAARAGRLAAGEGKETI